MNESLDPMTCTRLIGAEGERCATCGRVIVRTHEWPDGGYALQHEGPTIGAKLHALDRERELDRSGDR